MAHPLQQADCQIYGTGFSRCHQRWPWIVQPAMVVCLPANHVATWWTSGHEVPTNSWQVLTYWPSAPLRPWLVVWNMCFFHSVYSVENNHPNWRTHIFQRGTMWPPPSDVSWFRFAPRNQLNATERGPHIVGWNHQSGHVVLIPLDSPWGLVEARPAARATRAGVLEFVAAHWIGCLKTVPGQISEVKMVLERGEILLARICISV